MVGIDGIIIILIVGAIAGWLAGQIVRGFGFGLLWNIIIGIVVAWTRSYITIGLIKGVLSALLAIFLWFLPLLGVSLHLH